MATATTKKAPASAKHNISHEEWERRVDLAAAFRLFGQFGFDEGTAGHITARDPELTDHFWVNPLAMSFKMMRVRDLLLVNSKNLQPPAMWSYYNWIRTQVAKDTPWDQFARLVVTATGPTSENGAANFYTLHDDPQKMSEAVSLTFLGMSINCAKCHNHPMEKWTNDQYYGMANLFARVARESGIVPCPNCISSESPTMEMGSAHRGHGSSGGSGLCIRGVPEKGSPVGAASRKIDRGAAI